MNKQSDPHRLGPARQPRPAVGNGLYAGPVARTGATHRLLLASVGLRFALALAFTARKRGVELLDLDVTAVGRYEGLRFDRISLSVSSASSSGVLQDLLPEAQRVCSSPALAVTA